MGVVDKVCLCPARKLTMVKIIVSGILWYVLVVAHIQECPHLLMILNDHNQNSVWNANVCAAGTNCDS